MTVSTLPRLAEQAVAARTGADLFRFGLGDRIPDAAFARQGDGTYLVSGIDLVKSGMFNGLQLLDSDLDAMVERFAWLTASGIFLPPIRLDHSWSVLSVIGWFESIETYRRIDETDQVEKAFLRGTVRITGSVDYTPEQIVKAIKLGSLRNRSSELGGYITNAGVELPLIFYGVAYVDIPAVEGLAPVQLAHALRSEPRRITTLSEGSATMNPEQIARLAALRAMTTLSVPESEELSDLEQLEADLGQSPSTESGDTDTATGGTTGDVDADGNPVSVEGQPNERVDDGVVGAPGGADVDADGNPVEPPAADPAGDADADELTGGAATAGTPGAGAPNESDAELARLRAEITRLRQEDTRRQIETFRTAGVVVDANVEAATTLLSHYDEHVRTAAVAVLRSIPAPVELGARRGATSLAQNAGGAGTPAGDGPLIRLGMDPAEVGDLWSSLSSEQRAARQDEFAAWSQDHYSSL